MRRIFCLYCLVFLPFLVYSQIGVSLNYHKVNSSLWEENHSMNYEIPQFIGLELDYSLRLKKYRWHFLPAASFGLVQNKNDEFRLGFTLKNHIYPFDLVDDCNCPDFSEAKNTIKKSFFLVLSPGVYYTEVGLILNNIRINQTGTTFQIAFGAGYDFEINNMFSISPIVQYVISSKLSDTVKNELVESSLDGLLVSLRLGYRLDHRKKGRMRRF